jgi:hypothetical protein
VPVWPGRDGTAIVDVAATEPKYSDETVMNTAGTWTTTVPVCPGRDGKTMVDVAVVDPG